MKFTRKIMYPTRYTKQQVQTQDDLTDSSSIVWDLMESQSAILKATPKIGDSRIISNKSLEKGVPGGVYRLSFVQDSLGGRSLNFDDAFTVVGSIDTSPNALTIIELNVQRGKGIVRCYRNTPEPSQVTVATSTSFNTELLSDSGYPQNGKNVVVKNGANNISITVGGTENGVYSFQKEGTGTITFVAIEGKTIREVDGTSVMDGLEGSTASVSVVDSVISLKISNVV
jgi:hypothetical protein